MQYSGPAVFKEKITVDLDVHGYNYMQVPPQLLIS